MSIRKCPLCGREVAEEMLALHTGIDEVVLEMIRSQHPDWVAEDGACPQCVEYYRRMASQ